MDKAPKPEPFEGSGLREISAGAIARWRLVLVAAIGLVLLGALGWKNIPRLEDPRVEAPEIYVSMIYPGASPLDVESQVVRIVEDVLYGLEGVEWVESEAMPSLAFFHIKFEMGTAMDVALERVRGKVQGTKKDLPAEVRDPEAVKANTAFLPQMVVAVVGNRSDTTLTDAAKGLKKELLTVPGVSGIELRGDQTPAIRVRLDPVKLANHHLSMDDVAAPLRQANIRVPGGELKVGPLLTLLQIDRDLGDAESVSRVVIASHPDEHGVQQTVILGDVADVREAPLALKQRFLVDGQPAVGLELRFRQSEDAVAVGASVRKALDQLDKRFVPEGTTVRVIHDQPKYIAKSVTSFVESLGEGMLLVMLVITFGMGWRAASVVAGVLPLAAAGALFGLYELGFALEQLSIAGLIVALGLLVDDAIVVTESIQIMRDKGLGPVRAAVYGTARVFSANNGTTAVACASFIPLVAMGGTTGLFIRGIPVAVLLALMTSLIVAQLFTPWVASRVLKPSLHTDASGVKKPPTPIADDAPFDRNKDSSVGHDERNPILRALKAGYGFMLPSLVRYPWAFIVVFATMLAISFAALPKIGFQFFPKSDKPVLFVTIALPRGADIERTNEKLVETLNHIKKDPAVVETSAIAGGGYPTVFLGRSSHRAANDFADVMVRLKDGSNNEEVAGRLRRSLADIVGASANVETLYHGPPVDHPILVRVYGDDYTQLQGYAEAIKAQLRAQPGTINVADSLTESIPLTRITVDPNKAFRVGLSAAQVGVTVRWLYGQDKIIEFRRGDNLVQVIFENSGLNAADPLAFLADTPIPNPGGTTVPLREVGQVQLAHGYADLKSRNGRRIVEISADVDEKTLPSAVINKLDTYLKNAEWAPGYGYGYGGAEEETQKSFKSLAVAAVGGLLLIYFLLVLLFDSMRLATTVMLAVPFALIGAVAGLALTRNPFGFMAFLGLIALIGVYVNHKIYFVDRVREYLHRGAPLEPALRLAGQDRLRPVVLTALTAVLGLVPLTLEGGNLWSAFGWVSIFGLLASIPLSLVLLPALMVVVLKKRMAGPGPIVGGRGTLMMIDPRKALSPPQRPR